MSTGLRFFLPQSHALVGYRDTLSMLATNLNARRCALVPKLLWVYAYVASTPQTPLADCQNRPTASVRQKACCRGLGVGIPQREMEVGVSDWQQPTCIFYKPRIRSDVPHLPQNTNAKTHNPMYCSPASSAHTTVSLPHPWSACRGQLRPLCKPHSRLSAYRRMWVRRLETRMLSTPSLRRFV
jgi:hypothetical protein